MTLSWRSPERQAAEAWADDARRGLALVTDVRAWRLANADRLKRCKAPAPRAARKLNRLLDELTGLTAPILEDART